MRCNVFDRLEITWTECTTEIIKAFSLPVSVFKIRWGCNVLATGSNTWSVSRPMKGFWADRLPQRIFLSNNHQIKES